MIMTLSSTFRNTNIRAVYLISYIQRGYGTGTAFHRTYACCYNDWQCDVLAWLVFVAIYYITSNNFFSTRERVHNGYERLLLLLGVGVLVVVCPFDHRIRMVSWKFRDDISNRSGVIVLTDRQTDQQTHKRTLQITIPPSLVNTVGIVLLAIAVSWQCKRQEQPVTTLYLRVAATQLARSFPGSPAAWQVLYTISHQMSYAASYQNTPLPCSRAARPQLILQRATLFYRYLLDINSVSVWNVR